ncbi:MAG: glycogen debranching enzyme N-terminal domain-containing protein [Fusobacteria bacterium]|nr:glycogen debranching enzyme N-terminal domain-containing protein [Fusobacteriota bacterium]
MKMAVVKNILLGSFSSGAINGNLSRQYQGMLVNAFNPSVNRFMMAHKVEKCYKDAPFFTRKSKRDSGYGF